VPILVKDNISTGDKQPTTAGSPALEGARARSDATVVRLLRNAGAVILGKANLTEFAEAMAANVRRARRASNMTQEELADRAGLSVRHLGSIERAAVSASVAVLEQLARALQVDPCELIRLPPRRSRRR
jgi:ribosome-binding protein aMBF1 (putative translation factor)